MIKFKEYQQLDGTSKRQVASAGDCLRRFDKTPFPIAETDVVCPHFMLLAWANGCPYNCAWCFLKGTFRFYGQKPNGRIPMIFKDRNRLRKEFVPFLAADLAPELINTGELSDSLMDEGNRRVATSEGGLVELLPFSEWLMHFFEGTQHKILFLTKSTNIENFLKHEWQKNAVLAWSINARPVAERWELYAPNVLERLKAAKRVSDAGYEVRLRIDPMVPIDNWKISYAELIGTIFGMLKPTRITVGSLRGLTTTLIYCKDKSWTEYLSEKSNWGKKPAFKTRYEMFRFVKDEVESHHVGFGICKDTLAMWKALDMQFTRCSCNCIW